MEWSIHRGIFENYWSCSSHMLGTGEYDKPHRYLEGSALGGVSHHAMLQGPRRQLDQKDLHLEVFRHHHLRPDLSTLPSHSLDYFFQMSPLFFGYLPLEPHSLIICFLNASHCSCFHYWLPGSLVCTFLCCKSHSFRCSSVSFSFLAFWIVLQSELPCPCRLRFTQPPSGSPP